MLSKLIYSSLGLQFGTVTILVPPSWNLVEYTAGMVPLRRTCYTTATGMRDHVKIGVCYLALICVAIII